MMKPPRPVCVPGCSETSSLLGARSHGLTSTVTDRVMDADDENCHHKLNFEEALFFGGATLATLGFAESVLQKNRDDFLP